VALDVEQPPNRVAGPVLDAQLVRLAAVVRFASRPKNKVTLQARAL
jgi:hypothetical protein